MRFGAFVLPSRNPILLAEKILPKIGIELEQFKPVLRKEFDGDLWRT